MELIGVRFGRLVVVKEVEPRYTSGGRKMKRMLCMCDCGNYSTVDKQELTSKKGTRSCGCLLNEFRQNQTIDLSGNYFGEWEVLSIDKIKTNKQKEKGLSNTYFKCRCSCGTIRSIRGADLTNKSSLSCGKCNYIELKQGERYGRLTILGHDYNHSNDKYKKNEYYKCKCDCGNTTTVYKHSLLSGATKSCGCLTSKGEAEILKYLINNKINFEAQYKFENLLGTEGGLLRFDFAIIKNDRLAALIEYDGRQHFSCNEFFGLKPKEAKEEYAKLKFHDKLKDQYCKGNNIPLLRIPYWEFDNIEQILEEWLEKHSVLHKNEKIA